MSTTTTTDKASTRAAIAALTDGDAALTRALCWMQGARRDGEAMTEIHGDAVVEALIARGLVRFVAVGGRHFYAPCEELAGRVAL